MPTDFLDLLPIVIEDADTVRSRFDLDANAGLDPADSRYKDLTPGGFYWDATQPGVLECVRLWDTITEMVAAMFPGTAWGEYLDNHGETINVGRKDEARAAGLVSFVGPVGTLIPAGTVVSTEVADPSSLDDPVEFTTDVSITLAPTPGPTNLAAVAAGSGGTLPAGTYYYRVSAIVPDTRPGAAGGATIETIASNEVWASVAGATSEITLSWTAVAGATAYRVYRGTVLGGESFLIQVAASPYVDTGAVAPSGVLPSLNAVTVTASVPGDRGNVPAGTVILVQSPISGSPAVTNSEATSGGADVESDDAYRRRIAQAYAAPQGAGSQSDYERWSLEEPGIGYATVQPLWNGAGSVRVIITDPNNRPNSTLAVQSLQLKLDPIPGQGAGIAPVGAIVTVATPSTLTVDVLGSVMFEPGYSLDGAAGAIAMRQTIIDSVYSYLNTLRPGDDAILYKVIGQIMLVPGVLDVSNVRLNGAAANVTVGPLQVAVGGNVALT